MGGNGADGNAIGRAADSGMGSAGIVFGYAYEAMGGIAEAQWTRAEQAAWDDGDEYACVQCGFNADCFSGLETKNILK